MSGKRAKKVRQETRRVLARQGVTPEAVRAQVAAEVRARVEAEFDKKVKQAEHVIAHGALAAARRELVRPRPRRCPEWLWRRLVALVVAL